jgi:predicted ATPase/DNA-binding XRE family transcriptional regulator
LRHRAEAGEGDDEPVAEQAALGFAGLLRQMRADAGLTQEELAEAASLSPRSISDLERGVNLTARNETVRLLADALSLAGPRRALFEAAARGRPFAGDLPVQLSSFVGRVDELAGLATALQRSALVTVVGTGGVGKTRLALQAAAEQRLSFRDGAWLCELHEADDEETMAQAVLAALRVRARPGMSLAGSVVEVLRDISALLLLDNCEHLLSAASALAADILRGCREVRILATSRQALGVGGEQVFGLTPMSLPASAASFEAVAASDAVSLFIQRASAARNDFRLSPANASAIGEICRRLDGIPLAIELAAARVSVMRPAEIAELLGERFQLLTHGQVDAVSRHQTLEATVDWSYALLSDSERRIFNGLGVFPASFDATAAADVAGTGGLSRWDVLDALMALVAKSMVAEEEGPGHTSRYRLLETMRVYARQQLAAAGELEPLLRRHAEHYAAFAERAGPELYGPLQLDWQDRIRVELDNLQAAVTWAFAGNDQTRLFAFRIVSALAFAAAQGRGTVGVWAERALPQIGTCPPEIRATVVAAAGFSAFWAGDLVRAQGRAEDALCEPASSDPTGHGLPLALLSRTYAMTGQPERGAEIVRAGRQESAEEGNQVLHGHLLAMEALAWTAAGDHATARQPAIEAVGLAREVRNPALSAMAFYAAAGAVWLDEPDFALTLIEDSLALTRAGALDSILGYALSLAAAIRIRNGDLSGALSVLHEATVQQHRDDRLGLGITLQRGATALAQLGEAEQAAILSGAVSANFTVTAATATASGWLEIDAAQGLARRALGEAAYTAALRRGAAMNDDQVVVYALGEFRRLLDGPMQQ